jgi:hypothetical protein
MPSPDKDVFEDQYLVRYLVGALPAEEADRLDQLSVANDDFAWRLREIENDLVDSYVRSELNGETLARFKAFYMATAQRRQKVQFAEGLRQLHTANGTAAETPNKLTESRVPFWGMFSSSRIAPQFSIAFAALVMLLVAGYLLVQNANLRREVRDARAQYESIDQRAHNLENELNQQHTANTEAQKNVGPSDWPTADIGQLKTVSLLLPPPTRGLSSLQTVTIRSHTDLVVLLLTLESAKFPRYRVTLKDPATNKVVWQSAELEAGSAGDSKAVVASLPANLLKERNYIAEVAGLPNAGRQRIVGDYPFHVVLR